MVLYRRSFAQEGRAEAIERIKKTEMKRNFRRQAGGASSQLKQPDGTQKVRPFRRAKPDEIQREMTGGGVVGCVCGNDYICAGYYE